MNQKKITKINCNINKKPKNQSHISRSLNFYSLSNLKPVNINDFYQLGKNIGKGSYGNVIVG